MDSNIKLQVLEGIHLSKRKLLEAVKMCDEMEAAMTIDCGSNTDCARTIEVNSCMSAELCYQIKVGFNMIECLMLDFNKD